MGIYIKPGFVTDRTQDATKMKVGEFGFHGDVVIKKIEKTPKNLVKGEANKYKYLALGELTGHIHQLQLEDGTQDNDVMVLDNPESSEKYLVVPEGHKTTLRHQEHTPIELGEGTYEIVIQQEYDYLEERARAVAD